MLKTIKSFLLGRMFSIGVVTNLMASASIYSQNGKPAPGAEVMFDVTWGDDSGSESESYTLGIPMAVPAQLPKSIPGSLMTKPFALRRGRSYTLTMGHASTTLGSEPDYDYTLFIDRTYTKSGIYVLDKGVGGPWIVYDQHSMGGVHEESSYFYAADKKIVLSSIELKVDRPILNLLEENTLKLTGTNNLPSNVLFGAKFEIRRETEAIWYELQNNPSLQFKAKARVAGKFKVRAVLSVGGWVVQTEEKPIEVEFPDAGTILGGVGVGARMNQAWQDTLAATTTTSRREEGYYITIDTNNENYGITAHTIATSVGNISGASWDTVTIPRPPDIPELPLPTDKPRYTVAWYHTHTPTTHRSLGRAVGPSAPDITFGSYKSINIPGYAHDYVGSPAGSGAIPAAHPLNSSSKIYNITPPDRRPTP